MSILQTRSRLCNTDRESIGGILAQMSMKFDKLCYNSDSRINQKRRGACNTRRCGHPLKGANVMNDHTSDSPTVQIALNNGYICFVDEIDKRLSAIPWKVYRAKNIAYAKCYLSPTQRSESMHRIILSRKLGRELEKGEVVDHIDGDGLNNRRSNLRLATVAQNGQNRRLNSNNTSGYKGVYWEKKHRRWHVEIDVNGRTKYIGEFKDLHQAGRAYNEAAKVYHGEFARLNVIRDESGGAK
jgi:hypothetical protein